MTGVSSSLSFFSTTPPYFCLSGRSLVREKLIPKIGLFISSRSFYRGVFFAPSTCLERYVVLAAKSGNTFQVPPAPIVERFSSSKFLSHTDESLCLRAGVFLLLSDVPQTWRSCREPFGNLCFCCCIVISLHLYGLQVPPLWRTTGV